MKKFISIFLLALQLHAVNDNDCECSEPKKKFAVVMRHGERLDTLLNEVPFLETAYGSQIQEPHNPPLAPIGYQGYLLDSIQQIIKNNLIPKIIISSPYRRSLETAALIQKIIQEQNKSRPIPIMVDQELQEWSWVALMGRPPERIDWIPPKDSFVLGEIHLFTSELGEIMQSENAENTRPKHLARIKSVLLQHIANYGQLLVVGHLDTVMSLIGQKRVEMGGYVVLEKKGQIATKRLDLSRGFKGAGHF